MIGQLIIAFMCYKVITGALGIVGGFMVGIGEGFSADVQDEQNKPRSLTPEELSKQAFFRFGCLALWVAICLLSTEYGTALISLVVGMVVIIAMIPVYND